MPIASRRRLRDVVTDRIAHRLEQHGFRLRVGVRCLLAFAGDLRQRVRCAGADQFRNAERCRTAGVGKALWPHEVSAEAVRRDVRALLDEPGFRETAGRLRQEIDAMPSPAEVVGALERLVA